MKHKFAAFAFAVFLASAAMPTAYGRQEPQRSAADQQRIDALNDAYRNGLLTQDEYQAKLRELNAGSAPGAAPQPDAPISTRPVGIFDPALGVNYLNARVPSDWLYLGGLMRETSCEDALVTPFYRAWSPDGLSGTKMLPRYDWGWSTNAPYELGPNSDCPRHDGPISAQDFLKYMVGILHVEYVQDITSNPTPPGGPRPTRGANGLIQTADNATALTRFKINSIDEDEIINVAVLCAFKTYMPAWRNIANHMCSAIVDLTWAPKGRVYATSLMLMRMKLKSMNPVWGQLRGASQARKTAAAVGQIIANGVAVRQAMDMRFQQHEQLMAIMQGASDANLQNFNSQMQAKDRMSDDWCDAILGQQKRVDPFTGALYKTDSNYGYDWVNSDGVTHRLSDDINFNPNGTGTGTWTLTRNVH
ncbi:MAG TPA: hypothetical protein VLY23_18195 [Candidatus Acidoferrum sp.]|nr:hypothetical protein [Candidatus Acidoferrum sp.]